MSDQGKAHRILLVEDEPLILSLMARELSRRFVVVSARDFSSARRLLNETPDLVAVVADWYLVGGGSGLALLSECRARFPELVRVLVSGTLPPEMTEESLAEGVMDAFLGKPWRRGEVLATVLGALHHKAPWIEVRPVLGYSDCA